jgi:indolepyruvate ferredoxin oxidoreductase beta subunit
MELNQTKSVTVLIAALGGEGGGVLADWLIDAANEQDFPVQSTSIPGVAQRTGATTYYVEIFPVARSRLAGRQPVMSLTPIPGGVDVVVASELIEAGRVIQNGFVHPERTTLIGSTHREYAVVEKAAMSDGRYDADKVVSAAQQLARKVVLGDLREIALRNGTVINTVMFGAMVGAGALPLSKAACENAIRKSGKAVDASLKGFEAGYALVTAGPAAPSARHAETAAGTAPHPRIALLPSALHDIVQAGVSQVIDYQDTEYVNLYLNRVETLCHAERDAGGGPGDFRVTRETARYLALWMSYEDVIRVADLKTRKDRLARVRKEVDAKEGEPIVLTEYLKPGLDEICSILPPALAGPVRRHFEKKGKSLNVGLHLKTNTVFGFTLLAALRSLRPWRRMSSRYQEEQKLIEQWLSAIHAALPASLDLGLELALCGNLVKGYGETSERGHGNLKKILRDAKSALEQAVSTEEQTLRIRMARQAALADPEGRQLAAVLGLPAPELKAKPIRFVRKEKMVSPG